MKRLDSIFSPPTSIVKKENEKKIKIVHNINKYNNSNNINYNCNNNNKINNNNNNISTFI